MHELGIGIVSGLVAGLLTALVIIIIREYWIKVILPWYENRIYKDARIEGRWIATYGDIKNKEIIDLQRTGHTVAGRITVTEGLDQGKVYDLKGTFNNLILSGLYVPTDARSLD
jgi:hypothetical protein